MPERRRRKTSYTIDVVLLTALKDQLAVLFVANARRTREMGASVGRSDFRASALDEAAAKDCGRCAWDDPSLDGAGRRIWR